MSGFFSSILTLLLGWIRALINNLWRLINSDSGGALAKLLTQHWGTLVVFLCVLGVALDLIIYFFRWRPDYVWASRMRRRRGDPSGNEFEPAPQLKPMYEPPYEPTVYEPVQPAGEEFRWEEAPEATDWNASPASYSAPYSTQATYYQDVQAGFAPPVPPEQLYAPSPSYQASVHPGLDEDAFRQNFGLYTDKEAGSESSPVAQAPAFHPFTSVSHERPQPAPTAFSRLARRARNLVAVEAEDTRTIHDLQSTVNVSEAFHEPVYPQQQPREQR